MTRQPFGDAARRLGTDCGGERGEPLGDRSGLIVHDVVDASVAALDGGGRRSRGVLDVHQRPPACPVSYQWKAPPAQLLDDMLVKQARAGSVKCAVAQYEAREVTFLRYAILQVADRRQSPSQLTWWLRIEGRVLYLHEVAAAGIGPPAEALSDESPYRRSPGGREEMVHPLGSQAIGKRESAVKAAEVRGASEGGHLVDDDIRLGGEHG
jgi:hypothetical protein